LNAASRLVTNEYEEAVLSLEFTAEATQRLGSNPYRWKWVVLGLHDALQGLMVLALRGSNGLAVLPEDIAREWLKAYRSETKPPSERLDTFLNLYRKVKSKRMMLYTFSKRFAPRGNQGWSMRKLNSLRNDLAHFLPKTWLVELSGLAGICLDCVAVGEFLVNQSGNIMWPKRSHRARVRQAFHAMTTSLQVAEKRFA
jgi:hypothetical protein